MIYYVYLTECLLNGKYYIGQRKYEGINILKDKYIGSGRLFLKKLKEFGKNNFKKSILQTCKTRDEASYWEIYYIKLYDTTNIENGYNIVPGGHTNNSLYGKLCSQSLRVECIETGEIFESAREASRKTSISHISCVCRGDRDKAGGYSWRYKDDEKVKSLNKSKISKGIKIYWQNEDMIFNTKEECRNILNLDYQTINKILNNQSVKVLYKGNPYVLTKL